MFLLYNALGVVANRPLSQKNEAMTIFTSARRRHSGLLENSLLLRKSSKHSNLISLS